jgi:hypothetical protein
VVDPAFKIPLKDLENGGFTCKNDKKGVVVNILG